MSRPGADVVVRGVDKSFGDLGVLRGIDLEVPAGTLTAILGPSGCGKTTLLRILAGFETPDAGSVSIGGDPMAGVPVHRRRVGLLPQEGALFPHLSVAGNVAFGLTGAAPGRSATVRHWLGVVGGLRQRAAARVVRRPAAAGRAGPGPGR